MKMGASTKGTRRIVYRGHITGTDKIVHPSVLGLSD